MENTIRALFAGLMVFALAACGGGSGGSSSGGGGADSFAGSYNGTASVTVTGGGLSERVIGSIEFVVRADGTVVSDPGTEFAGNGSVQGNRFILNVAASSFNEPGVSCLGSFRIEGTISGKRITGTIRGSSISCNGVSFTVTGSFTAERVAQSRQALSGQALRAVRSFLGRSVR